MLISLPICILSSTDFKRITTNQASNIVQKLSARNITWRLPQDKNKNKMSGLSTADKSKPYLPLTGIANDGWSTDTEATATCFCGAVQLKVVSSHHSSRDPCCPEAACGQSRVISWKQIANRTTRVGTANRSTWACGHIRLPLHRLPQDHSIHVRIQLLRRRQVPYTPAWRGQS